MNELRVAVISTNNDQVYSGGRYHALALAYAIALSGAKVDFITNEFPRFAPDLAAIAPGKVRFHRSDFEKNVPEGEYDFVILTPTGIFLPRFYERALAIARRAKARIALINFESANMFNALSPARRDARLWDYWRRAVERGGLILSSTRASQTYARSFYRSATGAPIRFEVCGPPINSFAAREADAVRKDESVLAFVRPSDPHKGAHDLLEIDPELLRGRVLNIVSGGARDDGFSEALHRRFGRHAEIVHYSAISDVSKFHLLAAARALLFPSYFEGFGYPAVEAAYSGAEVVGYDLPVLQETVGGIAHLSKARGGQALSTQLARALNRDERRVELRAAVAPLVELEQVSTRIVDILLRSLEDVPTLSAPAPRVQWGPFEHEAPDPERQETPAIAPTIAAFVRRPGNDAILSVIFSCRQPAVALRSADGRLGLSDVHMRLLRTVDGWRVFQATMIISVPENGFCAQLSAIDDTGATCAEMAVELWEPEPAQLAVANLTAATPEPGGGMRLAFELGGSARIDEAAASTDGVEWMVTGVDGSRFEIVLRESAPQLSGLTMYLFEGKRPRAALGGFTPHPAGRRAPHGADAAGARSIRIERATDASFLNGVLRQPAPPFFGGIRCLARGAPASARVGALLRFRSGRVQRVTGAQQTGPYIDLFFAEPLDADEDCDGDLVDIATDPIEGEGITVGGPIVSQDPMWANGVWEGEGSLNRCGIILTTAAVDAVLRNPQHPGELRVGKHFYGKVQQVFDLGHYAITWLDRPLPPDFVAISRQATSEALVMDRPAYLASGYDPLSPESRTVRLSGHPSLLPGDVLKFSRGGLRRIAGVTKVGGSLTVKLEKALTGGDASERVRRAWPSEIGAEGSNSLLYYGEVRAAGRSPLLELLDRYRRNARVAGPMSVPTQRPRILFVTIVPPLPPDQGNRIVTHNFVDHLVARGFDVDIVLLGDITPQALPAFSGERVRIFTTPFPEWQKAPSATMRRRMVDDLRAVKIDGPERETLQRLARAAREYHPYFIVPDAMVRLAASLYARNRYHSAVFNYTHSLRVAEELQAIRPLPPTAVITHDALSRLSTECDGVPLDTSYRLCMPDIERDVLNSVPGARILAISRSERGYFAEIGVTNPIALCEYDGLTEIAGFTSSRHAFHAKRLVFQASGNPMNVAALNWFVQNCWPAILRRVPDARLAVCGGISHAWKQTAANVDILGVMNRSELLATLRDASIALNPTLAGTGLKIKTVEAACAGTPSVCLPAAVEGLEDVASQFCLVAHTPDEFTAACVQLLEDEAVWASLRENALDFATRRFSSEAVYGEVDMLMGWDKGVAPTLEDERAVVHTNDVRTAAALARGDTATSLHRILQRLAEDPGDLDAHCDLIRVAMGQEWAPDVAQLLRHAALAAPMDPRMPDLEREAAGLLGPTYKPVTVRESTLAVPLNAMSGLATLTPAGEAPGIGWSGMDAWGAWSTGRLARLRIAIPATANALTLKIRFMTPARHNGGTQRVGVLVNGRPVIDFAHPNDGSDARLESRPFPAPEDGVCAVEFLIASPAPIQNPEGDILDLRGLGIGLIEIGIFENEEDRLGQC